MVHCVPGDASQLRQIKSKRMADDRPALAIPMQNPGRLKIATGLVAELMGEGTGGPDVVGREWLRAGADVSAFLLNAPLKRLGWVLRFAFEALLLHVAV